MFKKNINPLSQLNANELGRKFKHIARVRVHSLCYYM